MKRIDNKIDHSQHKYSLDMQIAKISKLSFGNVGKYKFLIGEAILSGKELLEKGAIIKRFEYFPQGGKLKNQTDSAKNQYQRLGKLHGLNETVKVKVRI